MLPDTQSMTQLLKVGGVEPAADNSFEIMVLNYSI
jgi:hypothetical protein